MRALHTSDWHLGRSLYGKKRYKEFSAFLDWLIQTLEDEAIDVLLVAGDVFDTTTPSNRAQELYYRFLGRIAESCCQHVVVVAGNHDSPSFLSAPGELLKSLNVHVVGAAGASPDDEVIPLCISGRNIPAPRHTAVVCAVPYLRDRDVRTVEPGETIDDKNRKLVAGLKAHYASVVACAERRRNELLDQAGHHGPIPILAMGHLFAAGGATVDGDGVRELYVGSLARVGSDAFPSSLDYVALGHLHVPQNVAGTDHIRYSGSPLPMGFGEAEQQKQVVVIEFCEDHPKIRNIPIPSFQQLVRVGGTLEDILSDIDSLRREKSSAWLEIDYSGAEIITDLRERLDEALAESTMEIRRIKNQRVINRVIKAGDKSELLSELDHRDVFTRCLDTVEVTGQEKEELLTSYDEIVTEMFEHDHNAE